MRVEDVIARVKGLAKDGVTLSLGKFTDPQYMNMVEMALAAPKLAEALEVAMEALKNITTYYEMHQEEAEEAIEKIQAIFDKDEQP